MAAARLVNQIEVLPESPSRLLVALGAVVGLHLEHEATDVVTYQVHGAFVMSAAEARHIAAVLTAAADTAEA